MQRLAPLFIGKAHVLQLQLSAAGLPAAPRGFCFLQQRKHHSARAHPVHGDMEGAAERPERQEEFRRHQHQKQCGGDAPAALRARHRQRRACSCTAKGDKIHDGHTGKLHDQHLHGDPSERLCVFIHIRLLPCIRAEELQLLQPLHAVQKHVAHSGVFAPVFGEYSLGKAGYHYDRHRDQRHTGQQHHRHAPVDQNANAEQ